MGFSLESVELKVNWSGHREQNFRVIRATSRNWKILSMVGNGDYRLFNDRYFTFTGALSEIVKGLAKAMGEMYASCSRCSWEGDQGSVAVDEKSRMLVCPQCREEVILS